MGVFTGVIVYLMIWWLVVFMVLPWWIQPDRSGVDGIQHGAPDKPHLWRKAAITTAISAVLWLIVYVVIEFDLVSFQRMAEGL